MATYIIGDLQGCYEPLQRLLQRIDYSATNDTLWFCGDLVARGPQSLECLMFVQQLGNKAKVVLGNHDLHFIACHYGFSKSKAQDKLQRVIESKHCKQLVEWLCQQPLIQYDENRQCLMVHAGIAPEWSIEQAVAASNDVAAILQTKPEDLLTIMYGNTPTLFSEANTAEERWRFTVNSCTRMRFCQANGALELQEKGHPRSQTSLVPWYEFWRTKTHPQLFFGHWAALNGYSPVHNIHALDTGCVWGNTLTAFCIETGQRYLVAANS